MKRILLFVVPLVLLSACASRKPVIVQMPLPMPETMLDDSDRESVRYDENVKAYYIGRYVDPNDGLVMHEAHTVYRVETTAKWNLHPNNPAILPGGPVVGIVDTAYKAGPLTPEVAAEVEKQKAATQALLTQSQRMSFIINQLANVIPATTQVAQENDQLKAEMAATQTRLEILEDQFRQAQAQATFSPPTIPSGKGTNDW
jgi:hypothetical protein